MLTHTEKDMSNVNESTKILLLPQASQDLDVFCIKSGGAVKSLAFSKGLVYELREIGTSGHHDHRGEPQLPSGGPVRSLIVEFSGETSDGAVISKSNIIMLTKYDLVFAFLDWVSSRLDIYTSRFHASDDIMESFSKDIESQEICAKLEPILLSCIKRTSVSVQENNEVFFKICLAKINRLMASKIDQLSAVLLQNPNYVLSRKIKETLSDLHSEIPAAVLQQQVMRYSTDFLFAQFSNVSLKNNYTKEYGKPFLELEIYQKDRSTAQNSMLIAEQNLASLVACPTSKVGHEPSKIEKNSKRVKKQAVKVAVGKGALDNFFQRN